MGAIRTVGCQTQDNDSEQCLGTANAQNDSRGDHFVAVVVAATDLGVGRVWCRVWDAVGSLQPAAHHAPFIVRLLDSDDDSHGQKGLVFEDRRGWSMTSIGHARF